MDTSNDSIILIEDESSCESISCNCKELMAAICKRHGINKWIGNWCIYKMDERLVRLMTVGSNKHDDDSESNDSEESFSATGEELVRFLPMVPKVRKTYLTASTVQPHQNANQ